jgi:hypothetical protein
MSPVSWNYSKLQVEESATEWLRRNATHKNCRYPKKNLDKKDRNAIRIGTDCYRGRLLVSIEVDIEDKPSTQQHWPGAFLYLSLQLRLNLRQSTVSQEQLDAYLSYDSREVAVTKKYQAWIEQYTRGKLALNYDQQEWRIHNLNQLRHALEFWNVDELRDE